MNLLTCVFGNIKKMFRSHTLMLVILILGITVSSGVLCLFYTQGAAIGNTLNAHNGINRTLDFEISNMKNSESLACLSEYVEGNFKDVGFYCLYGRQENDYDVIGMESNDTPYLAMKTGEWLSGSGQAVIPAGSFDSAQIGDTVTILGKSFAVCGTYYQDIYNGGMYSTSGFSEAQAASAGVETEESANLGVFISYDDFCECATDWKTLRIRFDFPVSANKREKLASELSSFVAQKTGEWPQVNTESIEMAKNIYSIDVFGKFILYLIVALLSLINILQILSLLIKQNKKQYDTYLICGATKGNIYRSILLEVLIYTIISFTLGWFVSKIVVQNSYIKYSAPPMGFGIYIILLLLVCAISMITVFFSVRKILHKKKLSGRKDKIISFTHTKFPYLLRKSYTKSLLSELIIFLQILFLAYTFAYSVSYYFEGKSAERFARQTFSDPNTLCFATNPDMGMMSGSAQPSPEETIAAIEQLEGLKSWGMLHLYMAWYRTAERAESIGAQIHLTEIDSAILKNSVFKVEGEWLSSWSEGVDLLSCEYVPVVLTEPYASGKGLKVGDVIQDVMPLYNRIIADIVQYDDGTMTATVTADYDFDLKVVGIISQGDRALELTAYPMELYDMFYTVNDDFHAAYTPRLYLGNEPLESQRNIDYHYILFPDSLDRLEEYKTVLQNYGTVESINSLAQKQDMEYQQSSIVYYIECGSALLLLFIGVTGYNLLFLERQKRTYGIYFACGLSWQKAVKLAMTANSLLFLLGGIAGALTGIYTMISTRRLADDAALYSLITAIVFMFGMYFASSIYMLIKMLKTSPVSLIKKGD